MKMTKTEDRPPIPENMKSSHFDPESVPEPTGPEHDRMVTEGYQWCSEGYYYKSFVATREETAKNIADAYRFRTEIKK